MPVQYSYTSTPPMGRTACTEPQCLYSRAIPLIPLWAIRPIQSLSACTRVHFTFSPLNHFFYRNSRKGDEFVNSLRFILLIFKSNRSHPQYKHLPSFSSSRTASFDLIGRHCVQTAVSVTPYNQPEHTRTYAYVFSKHIVHS